ncbi:uncharacterized protein LOC110117326 [Athalia rosae]|uniref:uncharacterized protein LOC110117326 n=1 Tax=Athalia rosae TaxID=37344 RepID=UPI00203487DE|nr:uncharacterized protein LOC110117326 [Athalia rosae]
MIPLKDFEIFDGTLKNLGLRVDDTGPYRLQLLHLVFFGVVSFLMSLWHVYSIVLIKNSNDYIGIAAMAGASALMIIYSFVVVDCSFCTVLSIVRERFKLINMTIRRAKNRPMTNAEVTEISSEVTEDIVLRELKISREQYHELWDISNRVNQAYGLHLLVAAAASLTIVTVSLWQAYLRVKPGIYNIAAVSSEIAWALLYIIRLLFLAQACEFTLAEAQVTGIVLQELLMKDKWRSATKNEIRDFLMQHQLEVQEFTACKFFEVNSTMVHGILGTATIYLVILIQIGEDDSF